MNTQLASLTTIRDQVDLPLRDVNFIDVERLAIEYFQTLILSIKFPLPLHHHYTIRAKRDNLNVS
jgi:hypothetical protein